MFAAKHFDMVMGVDIHIIMIPTPGGPVPTPIPHPFVGMMFDPDDYDIAGLLKAELKAAGIVDIDAMLQPVMDIKNIIDSSMDAINPAKQINNLIEEVKNNVKSALGIHPPPSGPATILVNGLPRSIIGSKGEAMPPHIPIGGPFQKPPDNDCEAFLGSMTVDADGDHLCFLGCMAQSCQDIPKFPNSVIMAVPAGMPVMVGGPPVPSLNQLMNKLFDRAMDAIKNSKLVKNMSKRMHNAAKKGMDKLGIPADSFARDMAHKQICDVTGHPVVIATGKVYTTRTDFKLPGPVPLNWEREWKSTSVYNGPFGKGWHWNYDLALAVEDDALVVRMADGRPVIFPALEDGTEFTNAHEKMTMRRQGEVYIMRDSNNRYHKFESKYGLILEEKDRIFPLTSISNGVGHSLDFEYDDHGHLIKLIDSGNRELEIHTDSKGRILAVEAPHPDKEGETFIITSYKYDAEGRCTHNYDALNQAFLYEYQNDLLVRETNRNGLSFYFEYDAEDQSGRCTHTWGDGGIYDHRLEYNLDEQWTKVTNSLGHTSQYYWNDKGLVWKKVDPMGNTSMKSYTDTSKLALEINELGQITTHQYDTLGNKIQTTFPDSTNIQMVYQGNLLISAFDQNGANWNWKYNDHHKLISRTDSLGRETKYDYENGNLKRIIKQSGKVILFEINEQGSFSRVSFSKEKSYKRKYDFLGRTIEIENPKGDIETRRYDLLGRRINSIKGSIEKDFAYDNEGNITRSKENNSEVLFKYSRNGRIKSRIESGYELKFDYDTEGNLSSIYYDNEAKYQFFFDANMRTIEESGFDSSSRFYERDAIGQVVKLRKSDNTISQYEYDLMGRVKKISHSDGSNESYSYRRDGLLIEAINNNIKVSFERDLMGRILKEVQGGFEIESFYSDSGFRTALKSSLGANIRFGRDLDGNLENIKYSSGENNWEAEFLRDDLGAEIERITSEGTRLKWERNTRGLPLSQSLFSESGKILHERNYIWDGNERLKSIGDNISGEVRLEHNKEGYTISGEYEDGSIEYRYPDAMGNLFKNPKLNDRIYGLAGQLIEAKGNKYKYDPNGNLKEKINFAGETWKYEWNSAGMMKSVTRPDGKIVSFTYDALGRRIAKKFGETITRWIWDRHNIIHEWKEPSSTNYRNETLTPELSLGSQISIREKINFTDIDELNSQQQRIANKTNIEKNKRIDTSLTTWLFEPGKFAPIAKFTNKDQFSIITDQIGTPILMLNSSGEKVWEQELSIFGERRKINLSSEDCPIRFPGQYEDTETGLYYNRFRYYDPESGIYISRDPIRLSGGRLSLYSYVKDINTISDPFGLSDNCGPDLEDEVAQILDENGIPYERGRKIGENGEGGEIDFETDEAIIEVTVSKKGKLSQVEDHMSNPEKNPNDKPVILYAPNYGGTAGKDIENAGGVVARTPEELVSILK